jgi:hypothetical protein
MPGIFGWLYIFTAHENIPSDFRISTFYTAGPANQNEAAESLPGVIGSH